MPSDDKNTRQWYYTVGNSLYKKTPFSHQMIVSIEESFKAFREAQTIQIYGYTFYFSKMKCVHNRVLYCLTNDNGKWSCTTNTSPKSIPFNPEMNQSINRAFDNFKTASKKWIYFFEFDFDKMECTFNSVTYKITFDGGWGYFIGNELREKIPFDDKYNGLIEDGFTKCIESNTKDVKIDEYALNFSKMECVVGDKRYSLSLNDAGWTYYPKENPETRTSFAPELNKRINDAHEKFKSASKVTIKTNIKEDYEDDAIFDFDKMEYTLNGMTYKIFNNATPYEISAWNKKRTGHKQADKDYLDNFDSEKVVHRWFWWAGDLRNFSAYKDSDKFEPVWNRYPPEEEKELEEKYPANPKSTEQRQFNPSETKKDSMLQERIEGEKEQRTTARVAFCWCWYSNDGTGASRWVPYDKEVSEVLEDALIDGIPEVEITVDSAKYAVNFSQGIQFSLADTSKKCRIARFGTKIRDSCMTKFCWNYHNFNDMIPGYWDKPQTTPVTLSTNITLGEYMVIKRLVDLSNPSKEQHTQSFLFLFTSLFQFLFVF